MMATQLSMTCPRSSRGLRRMRRAKASVGTRLATLAIATLALVLILYGQQWVLQQSPAAPNELTVAACILDAVNGDATPANACTRGVLNDDKETL